MEHHSSSSQVGSRGVHIWMLLDRSGSMARIKDDVVAGVDSFFVEQSKSDSGAIATIAQFDTVRPYREVVHAIRVDQVRSIGPRYHPRGGTPLFDAIGSLLDHAERSRRQRDRLVVIMTDGHENASRRWNREDLFRRINRLRAEGWTFVFMGANQDSYASGRALGFADGSITNFAGDGRGARAACESFSRATTEWRAKSGQERARDEAGFFGQRKEAEDDLVARSAATSTVYISGGGEAYHRTDRCAGLLEGRRMVERRGGVVEAVDKVTVATAEYLHRTPCQVCMPLGVAVGARRFV
jgi:hypothetical protein